MLAFLQKCSREAVSDTDWWHSSLRLGFRKCTLPSRPKKCFKRFSISPRSMVLFKSISKVLSLTLFLAFGTCLVPSGTNINFFFTERFLACTFFFAARRCSSTWSTWWGSNWSEVCCALVESLAAFAFGLNNFLIIFSIEESLMLANMEFHLGRFESAICWKVEKSIDKQTDIHQIYQQTNIEDKEHIHIFLLNKMVHSIHSSTFCIAIFTEIYLVFSIQFTLGAAHEGYTQRVLMQQCWRIVNWAFKITRIAIWFMIGRFSFTKMHLKISAAKWRLFCKGLNMFKYMVYSTENFSSWLVTYDK